MKISIALTLIIIIAVFSYVSGYSIGAHNKLGAGQNMASQGSFISTGTATAAANTSAPSGGYGSPASEKALDNSGSSPGYGSPSPGYGR
jgi:hypothetical protein